MLSTKQPRIRGMLASAILGVLLALPVAAQIAGSGTRTESDDHLYPAKRTAPAPASTPRAVPALSGAPKGGYRASPLLKVDVQAAKRLGRTSGVRIISGNRVTVVHPGNFAMPAAPKASPRKTQMKLVRIGASPGVTYTRYGVDLSGPVKEVRSRPATIRINP